MKNKVETVKFWVRKFLIYGCNDPKDYMDVEDLIQKKNSDVLRSITLIAGIILFLLFAASFKDSTIEGNRNLYGICMIAIGILFFLSIQCGKNHPKMVLAGCYALMIITYSFGIVLGVFNQPDKPATTFCVLLFVIPLLFIDKPYRMSLLLIVVTFIFCYISYQIKPAEMANLDMVNSLSFLFLGIAVNIHITQTKIHDLIMQRYIERERDMDDLTKLMTKSATQRRIKECIENTEEKAALLVIDIDDFKSINDTYGHIYGDAVLRRMGECIIKIFDKKDVKGRFGGDEFVIFIPKMKSKEEVTGKVEQLTKMMKEQIEMPQKARQIHGSIGIALYPENGMQYDELFEHADEALYKSKRLGKDCYTFYFEMDLVNRK
ncbi:MAG: GGDEF domain-containing protein [Lachnospiraceae bacterium]|nr:GGDEF domain-containing protein [Lachnospiraceae bacterium]